MQEKDTRRPMEDLRDFFRLGDLRTPGDILNLAGDWSVRPNGDASLL
jgi:hypothetical protein